MAVSECEHDTAPRAGYEQGECCVAHFGRGQCRQCWKCGEWVPCPPGGWPPAPPYSVKVRDSDVSALGHDASGSPVEP